MLSHIVLHLKFYLPNTRIIMFTTFLRVALLLLRVVVYPLYHDGFPKIRSKENLISRLAFNELSHQILANTQTHNDTVPNVSTRRDSSQWENKLCCNVFTTCSQKHFSFKPDQNVLYSTYTTTPSWRKCLTGTLNRNINRLGIRNW